MSFTSTSLFSSVILCFVWVFFLFVLFFCNNPFECLCCYISVIGFRSSVESGDRRLVCVAVCERDGNWGKWAKGPYRCVLHIFAEAAGGAWLTDEWGVRGWHTATRALYYYISSSEAHTALRRWSPLSGVWASGHSSTVPINLGFESAAL